MKRARRREPAKSAVSKAQSYEEVGAFWDTRDLTGTAAQTRSVSFDVEIKRHRFLVAVDPGILRKVRQRAATRGLTSEILVTLWLKEKLAG